MRLRMRERLLVKAGRLDEVGGTEGAQLAGQ
jgi:hypothetical protein